MTPPADPTRPFVVTPVPPDLLAWVRQTLDAEALEAEVQAVVATGGITFDEVIAAVEASMLPDPIA